MSQDSERNGRVSRSQVQSGSSQSQCSLESESVLLSSPSTPRRQLTTVAPLAEDTSSPSRQEKKCSSRKSSKRSRSRSKSRDRSGSKRSKKRRSRSRSKRGKDASRSYSKERSRFKTKRSKHRSRSLAKRTRERSPSRVKRSRERSPIRIKRSRDKSQSRTKPNRSEDRSRSRSKRRSSSSSTESSTVASGSTPRQESAIKKTKIIAAINVSIYATKEQLLTLFGFCGRVKDIALYPVGYDIYSTSIPYRICFVKFSSSESTRVALHLTGTVLLDKSLTVLPCKISDIPPEDGAWDVVCASIKQYTTEAVEL